MKAALETLAERTAVKRVFEEADLRDLMTRDLRPPEFVIEHIVPTLAVTLLGGHGGTGKSMAGLVLAAHVATGRSWAGLIVKAGRAVFLSLEDPAALVLHRLRRIVTAYELPPTEIIENLAILDGSDVDAALMRELVDGGRRELHETSALRELRERIGDATLIVIDNASDAFDAGENERRMVRKFVRVLAQIARERNAAVLLLAHVDKNAAKGLGAAQNYSGSTAWHNSARSRLALLPSNLGVELIHEKSNLGRTAEPIALTWSDRGVLVPQERAQARDDDQVDADAEAILAALREARALNATVPDARMGPATAQRVLETFKSLPKHLHGQKGRDRFWAAMGRLLAQKSANTESYRTHDYKTRIRIVVAGDPPMNPSANPPMPPLEERAEGAARPANARQCGIGGGLAGIGGTCPRCAGEGCQFCDAGRAAA